MDGIYIVGNDRYGDAVKALVNSIRVANPQAPICLIPYDDQFEEIASWLLRINHTEVFSDISLLEQIDSRLDQWFDYEGAPPQRDKRSRLRNMASWFGPFDRFVCLDADILVFDDILAWCDHLDQHQFICCDDMHRHGGRWVFNEAVHGLLPEISVAQVFNCGFWGSTRGFISREAMFSGLEEARRFRDAFDFDSGVVAQPIINYIVLSNAQRTLNITRLDANIRVWIADPGIRRDGDALFHKQRRCPFVHWAGKPFEEGKFYYDLWCHYRDLDHRFVKF